ncbi:MAG: dihydropteroate synthase, partial [Oscillospiraceae bacterium]
ALESGDMDYIARQAVEQAGAGADILDINVGHLGIDEKQMMIKVIKKVQSVCELPLQIDSSDKDVIEAGLRVYNGKAIINSVNGEEKKMREILPLAKKYGAAVLLLTLDEKGIPEKAEKRFEIAQKVMDTAIEYGIKKEDIFVDCLTLASSAQQEIALETVKAISMVKEKLGLKTTLGVSNISFGLPNRELLNSTFMAMALYAGLDMPIINPNIKAMTDTVFAFHQLSGKDKFSGEYLSRFQNEVNKAPQNKLDEGVEYYISKGLSAQAKEAVRELLQSKSELEIVEERLIPALDEVGKNYESGRIFLPQLMQSAEAAKKGFEAISESFAKKGSGDLVKKGPIVIATVKGDVHDIGKNIVKTVLENYGYEVIDLGKDTDIDLIVTTAIEKKAKLVGLSALMTTTVVSMRQTIQALKSAGCTVPVVVGGAVLNEKFALEIGADFYAKDAQQTVSIAKRIMG